MTTRALSFIATLVCAVSVALAQTAVREPDANSQAALDTSVQPRIEQNARGLTRLSDEEKEAAWKDAFDTSAEFEQQAREYRNDARGFIERTFEGRVTELDGRFEEAIQAVEKEERAKRLDAIARLEKFVARHPNEPRFTPDAMTRLAELYYEKSVDDQQLAMSAFEEDVGLGVEATATQELVRSFEKSIALYKTIIERFPDYRLIDSIYYLLAWCLSEEGDAEEALVWFERLIEKHPTSRYVPEAWVRVGEFYFDSPSDEGDDKLQLAVHAYQEATKFKDSPLFDKALYKLGWSYYRLNDYEAGVRTFVRLIDYYDERLADDPDAGGDLRAEALQYTAISFADEAWSGARVEQLEDGTVVERFLGVEKLSNFFRSLGGRAYEWEVFRKLGDVLLDSSKNLAAVDAYREVLVRRPLAPDAPLVHERIVQAYGRERRLDEAFAEREKLVATYAEGGDWAQANATDQEVLRAAKELVERNLLSTAQYHHAQAFEFEKCVSDDERSPREQDACGVRMLDSYRKAASAYGGYLKEFPHSKNLYEVQYLHAETLYSSLQFERAAEEYARVRDSNTDDKYLANAAYYVVLALQKQIEGEERAGMLEVREPCTPETCSQREAFSAEEIPALRLKLIQAADVYMAKIPDAEDAPALAFKAAQTYFSYFDFTEARRRYEDLIARYPDSDYAEYSFNDILISYLLAEDWENVERFADRMLKESKVTQEDPVRREEKRLLKYGARFKRANALMEQKDWEAAADLYVSIVDDTEREAASPADYWSNADKALYNAATCFREFRKFDSAMRTYERLFNNYPKSPLAQSALFFVAEAAEKAFEFEKAIAFYQRLVKDYVDSPDRVAAAYNVAALLEALQRYKEAAEAYRFYARAFPAEADAPDMAYKAALIYQRMGDTRSLIRALGDFVATYRTVESQYEKVVQAYLRIGLSWAKLGNAREAQTNYESAVQFFAQKGLTYEDYQAAQAAGEARFRQIEQDYERFRAKKFAPKGRGKKLEKAMMDQLQELATNLESLRVDYESVIVRYRWPEWITAALLRLGNINEQFGAKLLEAPCPSEIQSELGEEGCFEYKIQLEDLIAPIMDKAILAYETAAEKATELRVVNEWTKLAMEKVCEFSPTKCKSLKEPRSRLVVDGQSPLPFLAADGKTPHLPVAPLPKNAPAEEEQPEAEEPETEELGIGAPGTLSFGPSGDGLEDAR